MDIKGKSPKHLFDEVIDAGLCTLCGACIGGCPYLAYNGERILLKDNCMLTEGGQCYTYCPRTQLDMNAISQQVFGAPYSADEIGSTQEVVMARSLDERIRNKGQYGGTVSTLLIEALADGLIDCAALARASEDKSPAPFLAHSAGDVLECMGSSYMACPIVSTYNQISRDDGSKLGMVAMPCQVLALSKMKKDPPVNRVNVSNIKLVIGLFCTWALAPDKFHQFLKENTDLPYVKKFDIPPPPANSFDVYTQSGKVSFPLEQIRKFIMPGCAYCHDMTAEFADISVGSVEGTEGWNTVIIRTPAGAELIKAALAKGKLETKKLPLESLAHLKEAALRKKKRALTEIVKKSGDKKNLLYMGLPPELAGKLLD
jgi:coenzyme F420 hydrogenase subunit beta